MRELRPHVALQILRDIRDYEPSFVGFMPAQYGCSTPGELFDSLSDLLDNDEILRIQTSRNIFTNGEESVWIMMLNVGYNQTPSKGTK